MRKQTFVLYRAHADEWANLGYKEALIKRRDLAEAAKKYYKAQADNMEKFTYQYEMVRQRYEDSDDAIKWNQKDLDEIKKAKKMSLLRRTIDQSKWKQKILSWKKMWTKNGCHKKETSSKEV